jgi:hypothetical protein
VLVTPDGHVLYTKGLEPAKSAAPASSEPAAKGPTQ